MLDYVGVVKIALHFMLCFLAISNQVIRMMATHFGTNSTMTNLANAGSIPVHTSTH